MLHFLFAVEWRVKRPFPSCFFWSLPDIENTAFVVPCADIQSLIYGHMNSVRLALKQNPKPFKLSFKPEFFGFISAEVIFMDILHVFVLLSMEKYHLLTGECQ